MLPAVDDDGSDEEGIVAGIRRYADQVERVGLAAGNAGLIAGCLPVVPGKSGEFRFSPAGSWRRYAGTAGGMADSGYRLSRGSVRSTVQRVADRALAQPGLISPISAGGIQCIARYADLRGAGARCDRRGGWQVC